MRICLALALLATAVLPAWAAPPTEEVTVTGSKSLRGIWQIALPASAGYRDAEFFGAVGEINGDIALTQPHGLRFGPARQQLCRVGGEDAALQVRCISFGRPGDGDVALHGSQLTMTWSADGRTRLTLRGALETSDHFNASFILEDNRERHSDPDRMAGERINLGAATDQGGLGLMLEGTLAALSAGDASLLMPKAPDVAVPEDLAALGRVQALYHVGEAPLLRDPQQRPALEVYAVEFAGGERLCGIHLAYGKVDGLRCV